MRASLALSLAALSLAGCNRPPDPPVAAPAPVSSLGERVAAPGMAAEPTPRGAVVYAANCASCHGVRAEGAKDWHRPGPDGKYPPPPLDGSGHAWHHPQAQLRQIILDGTQARGGGMPAWRGKLSPAEVDAVIAWFQSLWPPELYRTWREMDQNAR